MGPSLCGLGAALPNDYKYHECVFCVRSKEGSLLTLNVSMLSLYRSAALSFVVQGSSVQYSAFGNVGFQPGSSGSECGSYFLEQKGFKMSCRISDAAAEGRLLCFYSKLYFHGNGLGGRGEGAVSLHCRMVRCVASSK